MNRKALNPRKLPAQARARETVDAILQAAAQVFSESGYAGATTNKIAERAGVSIGSLYQYFPNKDAILDSLLEKHTQEGYEVIVREIPDIQAIGKIDVGLIRRLIEIMIALHKQDPALHRVLSEETFYKRYWNEYKRNENEAVGALSILLKNTPNARKSRTAGSLRLLSHAIEAMTHRFVLYGYEGLGEEEFIDELADMMSRYLLEE